MPVFTVASIGSVSTQYAGEYARSFTAFFCSYICREQLHKRGTRLHRNNVGSEVSLRAGPLAAVWKIVFHCIILFGGQSYNVIKIWPQAKKQSSPKYLSRLPDVPAPLPVYKDAIVLP